MFRSPVIELALALLAAHWLAAQSPSPTPRPVSAAAAPAFTPRLPVPKVAGPPARLLNPASPAARLIVASPEQREKALEHLAPEQQERIRKQLEWFDSLPKPEQELQIRRLQRFAVLPPDRKAVVRQAVQAFNRLPQPRKTMVRRIWQMLEAMPARQRAARLNSPALRDRFSPDERKILADLASAWLPQ